MAQDASLKTLNEKLYQKSLSRSTLIEERNDLQDIIDVKNAQIAELDTTIAELQATIGAVNPPPTIGIISPNYFTRGSGNTVITITGTGFVSGSSQVYVNGTGVATTFVSATSLTCTVTSGNLTLAGSVSVYVRTAAPGGGQSNTFSLPVINGVPNISTITPNTISAASPATPISLTGTSFYSNSAIYINGVAATTTLSGSNLLATIPVGALAVPGYVAIYVVNPGPGGGQSNQLLFTVT